MNEKKPFEIVGGINHEENVPTSNTEIKPLTQQARRYLTEKRGFRQDTVEAYRLGCAANGNIVIPFYDDQDRLRLTKFRHPEGKMLKMKKQTGNGEWHEYEAKTIGEKGSAGKGILFGSHLCDPNAGALVICFGDYDAMSVAQSGIPNCVSLPFGDKGFEFIDRQWQFLERFSEIIIFPDNDQYPNPKAEMKAQEKLDELAMRLGKHRCRLVKKSDMFGAKDANELLLKKGSDANRNAVVNADWFPTGIYSVADAPGKEIQEGFKTGISQVDKANMGLGGGQLLLVSGDNESGKTTETLNITANFVEQRIPTFIWSGEQPIKKMRYWFERILAGESKLETIIGKETGFEFFYPSDSDQIAMRDWYREYFYQLVAVGIDYEAFFEAAQIAIRRYGCKLIIIDNLMAFTGGEGDGYYQAQGDFAQACKLFAMEWDVAVILICHNRKFEQKGNKPRLPTKDDVDGSKKVTNWADCVLQMYRVPEVYSSMFKEADTVMILCKAREDGTRRNIPLRFNKKSNRFIEMEDAWKIDNNLFSWKTGKAEEEDIRFKI